MTKKNTTTKDGTKGKAEGSQEGNQGNSWHEYARTLTNNIYADREQYPMVGELKARMVILCDAVVHDESVEADILFNIFDELFTLIRADTDEGPVLLEVAREAAFMRSSRCREVLYPSPARGEEVQR